MPADPARRDPGSPVAALLLLVAGSLTALGSSGTTPSPRERLVDEPPPAQRRAPPLRRAALLPYPPCPAPAGFLPRAVLEVVLSRGPGVFLSGLDVTMVPASALPEAARQAWPSLPSARGGEGFGGWRLDRFHPGDPCLARASLRPGDVVVSVNGNALRRPEDLGTLWAGLRQAPNLVVRLVRGGEPLTFIVRIADPSPPGAPRSSASPVGRKR